MANHPVDSRRLASLVSSLVAQLLLSLPHHPSADAPITTSTTAATAALLTLLHLLNSSSVATSLSLLHPLKRRKLSSSISDPPPPSPLPSLDSFKPFFRMSAASFQWLCGLLDPLLDCRDPAGSPLRLSPDLRLAIALFRLATASPYSDVASRFRVSPPTARFCTKQLCRVLCTNFRFWLAFPTSPPDLTSVSAQFQALTGFPNCCGIIHSSRFQILTPVDGVEHSSIVAQIVVDNSCRILSIVAGFRGEKGGSRVLKSSALYKDVEEGKALNGPVIRVGGVDVGQYLVGDGGHPLLPWLMVPFLHPAPSSGEGEFNAALRKMRLPALRTIGSLRNWGVLSKPTEEEEVKMAVACIGACSILHNALLMREDYSALSDEVEDHSFHDPMPRCNQNDGVENEATAIRRALVALTREVRDSN